MAEHAREQAPTGAVQLLHWILTDDRRTARASKLLLAAAAWTAPPVLVIGLLIGLARGGAGLLISIAALLTMAATIGGAVWMLAYQQRRGTPEIGLVRLLVRRTRRVLRARAAYRAGLTGRHSLSRSDIRPVAQPTRPISRSDFRPDSRSDSRPARHDRGPTMVAY
ncbi:MAG TPA: hypothetical protein VG756_02150 [Pseudonocardiaceae bacterium]|nr:hypothetical protein [Pseudonocardiaceae bacterium]